MTGTPLIVMTIGGSDSGAGAGIQADLKTLSAHGVFGTTVVTAVTAQNTRGVEAVEPIPLGLIESQIEALVNDLQPEATKTGLLGRAGVVRLVAEHSPRLANLVVDPVLVDRTGRTLVDPATVEAYRDLLIPAATIATPNHREASLLVGKPIRSHADQEAAARELARICGTPILVTGGRTGGAHPVDVFSDGIRTQSLAGRWASSLNVHGTGDALSASIAARLVRGAGLLAAVGEAKAWVARAIAGASDWRLGRGEGPIDHFGWATSCTIRGGY